MRCLTQPRCTGHLGKAVHKLNYAPFYKCPWFLARVSVYRFLRIVLILPHVNHLFVLNYMHSIILTIIEATVGRTVIRFL